MNAPFDPSLLMPEKFAVGQPVSRKEDPALLRGQGRYTDDLNRPAQLYGVMVRSRVAHGVVRSLDIDAASDLPGVRAVITAATLDAAGIRNMPAGREESRRLADTPAGTACLGDRSRPLRRRTDRHGGGRHAETGERRGGDGVRRHRSAAGRHHRQRRGGDGAPQLHADAPGNLCLDFHYGDSAQVADAFARAAHVTTLAIRNNRIVVCPMEPRSAIAEFDAEADRLVLRLGCQGVFGQRALLSSIMGVPVEKLRVLTGNVGGSFGMKASAYPEYICLLHAARTLGRPVKWTDERSESFLSDSHGRDHEMTAELALDAEGKFLALRVTGYGNLGAWLSNATTIPPTLTR